MNNIKVSKSWVCPKCGQQINGDRCEMCNISYFIATDEDFGHIRVFFVIGQAHNKMAPNNKMALYADFISTQSMDAAPLPTRHCVLHEKIQSTFPMTLNGIKKID